MESSPNYHCPVCGTLSEMIISEEQAFCTNQATCRVICFNPSLPDGGMSNVQYVDWQEIERGKP